MGKSLPCFGLQSPLKGNGSLSPVTASHLTSLGFRFPWVKRICFHVLGLNKQAIKCSSRLAHGKSFGKCYYGFCPWYVCLDVQVLCKAAVLLSFEFYFLDSLLLAYPLDGSTVHSFSKYSVGVYCMPAAHLRAWGKQCERSPHRSLPPSLSAPLTPATAAVTAFTQTLSSFAQGQSEMASPQEPLAWGF